MTALAAWLDRWWTALALVAAYLAVSTALAVQVGRYLGRVADEQTRPAPPPWPDEPDRPCAQVRTSHGVCTLPDGHDGRHEAWGVDQRIATWPVEERPL